MFNKALKKRRAGESGFTLIELLVVIVILGILAAIVVFAIGGLSDSASTSACNADRKTLETAEDAYYATPDGTGFARESYATEQQLLDEDLIKTLSDNWDVTSNGTSYTIDPASGSKCSGSFTFPAATPPTT